MDAAIRQNEQVGWHSGSGEHKRGRSRFGRALGVAAAAITLLVGCSGDGDRETTAATSTSTSAAAEVGTTAGSTVYPEPRRGVLLRGQRHVEKQQFGADTFVNYQNASGKGPRIPIGMEVVVDCVATGPVEAAPSAKGKWYHIIEPPELNGYYVAANTFENGDTSGPIEEQPAVDPNVKSCP